jgi:hypothetical protein
MPPGYRPNNNGNNSNGPQGSSTNETQQVTSPMPSISASAVGDCVGCEYGAPRSYGGHRGVDIVADPGTVVVSPVKGKVEYADSNWYAPSHAEDTGKGMVGIKADDAHGGFPAGTLYASGHITGLTVSVGDEVEPGTKLGVVGSLQGDNHNHFYINSPSGPDYPRGANGNVNPTEWVKAAMSGDSLPTIGGDDGGGASTGALDEATAKAAAFATYFNIDGVWDTVTSQELRGERSLMNDKPLFPFIEQLCSASLRRFQSMPNGNFFAFYPDYFGGSGHRSPYWDITDTEIIDGQIELNDDALATHVYVVGDTSPFSFFDGVDVRDKVDSAGVINIFNAFQANFITGHNQQSRAEQESNSLADEVIDGDAFLKKYGARPYYDEVPMVRSAFYEAFLAYQRFCLLWSQQFATSFSLTFMPEIFPGGIVRFSEHKIQMFVEEVTHSFDYENGFNTDVVFSSPASTDKTGNAHQGMIRAGVLKGR